MFRGSSEFAAHSGPADGVAHGFGPAKAAISRRAMCGQTIGRIGALAIAVCTLATVACTIKEQDAPPLSGPSELGLSINVQAVPDTINQDGASQSQLVITARDANGQPRRDLLLRVEITVDGLAVDFGRLSARTVATGSDGIARVNYTAPPAPPEPVDTFTVVTLRVTPSGSDFANAVARQVNIRLIPAGVLIPPNGTPTADFTWSQPAQENTPVQFDASPSRDDGTLTAFVWDFGDGTPFVSGMRPSHTFARGGTYSVTLTVTDDRGTKASTTKQVAVASTANPSAAFSVSPTTPAVDEAVFFNASASQPSPGRAIVSYQWTFGDGGSGSGQTETHTYGAIGSYNVTLTVTDDAGKTGTSSTLVTVIAGLKPTPAFTFSPANPLVNQTVFFNGTVSTAPPGRTITNYEWQFGDGFKAIGPNVQHSYNAAGDYIVTLTVTDNTGAFASTSQSVKIANPTDPVADFTISPNPATAGAVIQFDAGVSRSPSGAAIVSYQWVWGDGTPSTTTGSPSTTHTYAVAGTYTVRLTITDSNGRTGTTTKTVEIL